MSLAALLALAVSVPLPKKVGGMYLLIADDTVDGYKSTDVWQPSLYPYQVNGSNVMWLSFVNPVYMPRVPVAMQALATCKGQAGCPPVDVPVIFSIGGAAYSEQTWGFLQNRTSAEAMAEHVAEWQDLYGADGVDLDIEGTAGMPQNDAENLGYFVQKLKSLKPGFIVTQPVYGYPQITAENYMVNNGWTNATGPWTSTGLIDTVGIMYYDGIKSLNYVVNYANGTQISNKGVQPITVNVPTEAILGGMSGGDGAMSTQMAQAVNNESLGGFMVWYASVYDATRRQPAFQYDTKSDASVQKSEVWAAAVAMMGK